MRALNPERGQRSWIVRARHQDGPPEAAAIAAAWGGRRRIRPLGRLDGRFQPRPTVAGGHLAGDGNHVGDCRDFVHVLVRKARGGRGRVGTRARIVAAVRATWIRITTVVVGASFNETAAEAPRGPNSDAGTHLALNIVEARGKCPVHGNHDQGKPNAHRQHADE